MGDKKVRLGQIEFRTKRGDAEFVTVSRVGKSVLLSRWVQGSRIEKNAVFPGLPETVETWISESVLNWGDLVRDTAKFTRE